MFAAREVDEILLFFFFSKMLLKFGLVYSRLMSDAYKVYISLVTFLLQIADVLGQKPVMTMLLLRSAC